MGSRFCGAACLNDLDVDGGVYYLPADLAIGGILYNKTLFQEHGWTAPTNYEEFFELCNACKKEGIRPIYLSRDNQGEADNFLKCFALTKGHLLSSKQWLEQFNQGKAPAQNGKLEEVFDLLDGYKADGVITADEVGLTKRDKGYSLAARETAMVGGDAAMLMHMRNASSPDEFRLMPFFNREDGKGYFFVYPMMNLAVGAHVKEDPQKEEIIDRVLQYITSKEGQRDLMRYDKGVISPVMGVPYNIEDVFYESLNEESLNEESLLSMPSFDRCTDVLNEKIGQYLQGNAGRQEIIDALELANNSIEEKWRLPIAQAERNFTYEETNALVLNAMRWAVDTDMAFLVKREEHGLNVQWLGGSIYAGDVTLTDLYCIHPNVTGMKVSERLDKVTLTGRQLLELLPYDSIYYYTGLTVQYRWDKEKNSYAPAGLLDEKGEELSLDDEYTVAVLGASMTRSTNILSRTETPVKLLDAMEEYMTFLGTLTPPTVSPAGYEK